MRLNEKKFEVFGYELDLVEVAVLYLLATSDQGKKMLRSVLMSGKDFLSDVMNPESEGQSQEDIQQIVQNAVMSAMSEKESAKKKESKKN
jgi:SpoVK/Ycf46/Vps4 family AAA+-type ATPase